MREDFCAFILTHGRPDRVLTLETIRKAGYTGAAYLVIDDEDPAGDDYRQRYGADAVLAFSKSAVAETFDEGDNFIGRRGVVVYARNACFELARRLGYRYFIELDDDYSSLYYRFNGRGDYGVWRIDRTFDALLEGLIEFLECTPALSVAISQGGDHIGGGADKPRRLQRKAMNTFVCSVERPFKFLGRINEDVNTYVSEQRKGGLFFTVMQAQVNQLQTQSNAGGMTDLYVDQGTYVKSFYSVMFAPSCVKIGVIGDPRSPHRRIHHAINWHTTAPRILRETVRKQTTPPT